MKNDRYDKVLGFATQGSGGDDEARLTALLSHVPAEIVPFNRKQKLRNIRSILQHILRERPSLVVMEGTGIAGGLSVLLGKWIAKTPYVISSGDAVGPFIASKAPLLGPFFNLYEKLLYKGASGFIGWTPYLTGRALTYGTRYGITAAGWAPFSYTDTEIQAARSSIRQRYGIPDSALVVGIVGSLNWNRRIGYCYGYELVKALKQVNRQDVWVLIVGGGSGKERLEAEAGGLDNIVFTGRVAREEVPAYLSAMDVGSLPQSVDQVGSFRYTTKVSEYVAVRLPIVTGNIPMAYDLDDGWMYRLQGDKPWDSAYIQAMVAFMESLTAADARARKNLVPYNLALFDKQRQIAKVGEFIEDLVQKTARVSTHSREGKSAGRTLPTGAAE